MYEELHPGRKRLVKPVAITDSQYAASWLNKKFKPNPYPEQPRFMTVSGKAVRSKSEMIIADCLFEADIPFIYEYPFKFRNGALYYTDFYCLNQKTREEFVWEHFGRMDEPAYCKKAVRKIRDYSLYLPENCRLLVTFEDGATSFSRQLAENALKSIVSYVKV